MEWQIPSTSTRCFFFFTPHSSFLQPPPLPLLLPFFFFVSPNSVRVPLCILAYARNGNAGGDIPMVDCCQAQALAVGMWAKTVELQFLGHTGCSELAGQVGRPSHGSSTLFQPPSPGRIRNAPRPEMHSLGSSGNNNLCR